MTIQITALGILFFTLMYLPVWGQTPSTVTGNFDERDADLYIVNWKDMPVHTVFGALQVRDMLTARNEISSAHPKPGAVLTKLKRVSYGFLIPGTSTESIMLKDEQYVLYIVGGTGTITMGRQNGELMEGVGVLIPPGLDFTIANTGAEPLTMYIIVEPIPDGFSPVRHLVIHNAYDNEISTNTNRKDSDQWLFSLYDGLSTAVGINPVVFEPRTLYPPHTHTPETEEVWINLSGEMECYIGNQHRTLPAGSAYRPPSDNETPHVNLNATTTTKRLLWIMVIPRDDTSGTSGPVM